MHFRFLCATASLCGLLGAQSVIAPATSQNTDANAAADLGGVGRAQRAIVLIDARHLQTLRGKLLTEIWLRRDAASKGALTGGTSRLTLKLSQTARLPEQASALFDQNHGAQAAVVFQGDVTVPNSPAVVEPYDPWAAANSVRIPLQSQFAYVGGTLCIEFAGAPNGPSRYWGVDASLEASDAAVAEIGRACPTNGRASTLTTVGTGLSKPGGSVVLHGFGQAGGMATLMIGLTPYGSGIDLSVFGATGCMLYNDAALTFLAPHVDRGVPGMLGAGRWDLQVPADPGFGGITLRMQILTTEWALPRSQWSNAAGITTSNGIALTTSAKPPQLGMSLVTAPWSGSGELPASGTVDAGRGPVVRIEAR